MNIQTLPPDDPAWNQALAAAQHDTYQLPTYVSLEAARTHSRPQAALATDDRGGRQLLLPYLLRDCDAAGLPSAASPSGVAIRDVVSPYGYCGYVVNKAAAADAAFRAEAWQALLEHWRQQGVCSAFLRLHPLLNEDPAELRKLGDCQLTESPTVSIDLARSEEELWKDVHRKTRTAINKSRRLGCKLVELGYEEHLPEFREIYEDTMVRTSAAAEYFFNERYFQQLGELGSRLHLLAMELGEERIAAGLFLECEGILQAHLGGTRSACSHIAPFSQLLFETALWAKSGGCRVLHLGGGLGGQEDRLWRFKSTFSSRRHTYRTARLVVDAAAYGRLVELRAAQQDTTAESLLSTGFFPAYRQGPSR